ncbi:isopropylmalate isomerase (plasmid) [Ruegeria sp. SCSIO 43209]|nr:isopropylmalate isomerase [Ruegeria sp. SCSIO 43209]
MLECAFESWSPTIGDPSLMGWLTVVAYVVAAVVSLRTALVGDFPAALAGRERAFWVLLAVLLSLLALNKQLDLQSFLTASARCLAIEQGWYENRRPVQLAFIGAVGICCLIIGWAAALLLGRSLRRTWLALLGLCVVLAFILIRAAGFHHVDTLIGMEIYSIRANWVLELSGLVLILIAGLLHPRWNSDRVR